MSRTAYTASEWREFEEGFDDSDEAWSVACHLWTEERIDDLHAIRKYCEKDKEAMDLWVACEALAPTESNIFFEIEERLLKHLWEHSEGYRDYCQFRQLERMERVYFTGSYE
jgi:hypothetical protein